MSFTVSETFHEHTEKQTQKVIDGPAAVCYRNVEVGFLRPTLNIG